MVLYTHVHMNVRQSSAKMVHQTIYVCTYMHTSVNMCIHMCMYILYIYMHTHTHAHTRTNTATHCYTLIHAFKQPSHFLLHVLHRLQRMCLQPPEACPPCKYTHCPTSHTCATCIQTSHTHAATHKVESDVRPWNTPAGSVVI